MDADIHIRAHTVCIIDSGCIIICRRCARMRTCTACSCHIHNHICIIGFQIFFAIIGNLDRHGFFCQTVCSSSRMRIIVSRIQYHNDASCRDLIAVQIVCCLCLYRQSFCLGNRLRKLLSGRLRIGALRDPHDRKLCCFFC